MWLKSKTCELHNARYVRTVKIVHNPTNHLYYAKGVKDDTTTFVLGVWPTWAGAEDFVDHLYARLNKEQDEA